jgi:hypothetical protein
MGKCADEVKGAPEVKGPEAKESKGSCGCGCVTSGKEK